MKKQVSIKSMAMASKNGGALDSHSSSSSSSTGGASGSVSGGNVGAKGQDIPKKSKRNHKNNFNGKQNFKQHLYTNAQKTSVPNKYVEDVFIDKDEELADDFDGLRITRKTNLSHLLNFRYTDSTALERHYGNGQNRSSHTGLKYTSRNQRHKVYDKYQFIQANCKFVVDVSFDDVLLPDQFVDWDRIVQVQLLAPNIPYCPICLENSPAAPRITKCGHVYCFPCVLQLISLSDHKWAKCPICYDAVSEADLRDVKCLNKKLYKIGDNISFNMMTRNRNSLKVERVVKMLETDDAESSGSRLAELGCSEMDLEKVTKYDREQQILLVHQPALQSLELRKQDHNEEEEKKFICLASKKVQEVIEALEKFSSPDRLQEVEVEQDSCSNPAVLTAYASGVDKSRKGACDSNATGKYNFYQCSDGQLIFLNTFNVRCLLKEYGSLENSLETLTGQIVDLCETRVDDYFRNKYRFLAHLPLTTVVTFAEIDLRPPTLSKQTLKHFAEDIRLRKEEKDRKRKEERKRDNRINREMQKKMGSYLGHSNASFYFEDDEDDEGAMFERMGLGEENFPSFASHVPPVEEESNDQQGKMTQEKNESSVDGDDDYVGDNATDDLGWASGPGMQFTSFANVLMTTCASPTNKNLASVWGSPSGGCTSREDANSMTSSSSVWSRSFADTAVPKSLNYAQRLKLVEKNEEELRPVAKFAESEDVDIDLPAPSFNESFSVAFEKALYKQGGQKSKKKKKNGTKLSLDSFNSHN